LEILSPLWDGAGWDLEWDDHQQPPPPGGVGRVEEWRFSVTFGSDEAIPTMVVGLLELGDHAELVYLYLQAVTPYGPPLRRRWRALFVENERESI
jgi:hypothetical protein